MFRKYLKTIDHSQLLIWWTTNSEVNLIVKCSKLAQLLHDLSQHKNYPRILLSLNFLSLFQKFLSVSQLGSFFNAHFQILPALARKLRSFRTEQCSSDQMQILKDHSAHSRALGIAYRLWLPLSIDRVFNLTKLKNILYIYIYIYIYICTYTCVYR